ncbi:hypothetical protein GCK32_013561 [Trichostrongylus colubriformis]|uniref:VWFA domain-containing protein n=1 Tax=Trichostrongylus colubriformis TaxID=6319 RepID=A0AAN8FEA5_TRICO
MICMSCNTREITRSVVFIIDDSGSVGTNGWEEQKKFVANAVSKHLKGARTGVVKIHCPARKMLDMGLHTPAEIMSSLGSYTNGWSGLGDAAYIAEQMLLRETTSAKGVIWLSDGEPNCMEHHGSYEYIASDKWRREKVKIVYVAVNSSPTNQNILRVAGDSSNVIPGGTFGNLGQLDILQNVMEKFCDAID